MFAFFNRNIPDRNREGCMLLHHNDADNKKKLFKSRVMINNRDAVFPIIAIGASAGDLETLEQFLKHIPNNSSMAFIIITHLDNTYESVFRELIKKHTSMPVLLVTDELRVQPNTVYVIPPHKTVAIQHGVLLLVNQESPHYASLPINFFFQSLIGDINNHQIELELQNEEILRSQSELEALRNKYINLYDFAPAAYFTLDEHGLITEVNQLGADLFGVNKNSLINKNFSRYVAITYQDAFYKHKKKLLSDSNLEICEVKFLKRKDAMFYARLNSRIVLNSLTGQKQILIFISHITDHQISEELCDQKQAELYDINLTRSMSELTLKMAHDINQPVSAIYNYLHGCIRRLEKGDFQVDEILTALNNAVNQSHRTNEIILRMKNYSCKDFLYYESVCINEIINESISLIEYEILDSPLKINYLEINYHSLLMLDKIHIQQVILNLLRNAIEAMGDDKTREPKLIIETNILSKSEVEICIRDNGPGIKAENLHKLFDPHFTTKSYGIGQGLAVSRLIVEAHGGTLVISSDSLNGTCAKILLPIRT
jgi:two-component system cell cycle sensor histidine kinase/response regulator CckA